MMKKRLAVIMLAGMMMSLSPVGAMAAGNLDFHRTGI